MVSCKTHRLKENAVFNSSHRDPQRKEPAGQQEMPANAAYRPGWSLPVGIYLTTINMARTEDKAQQRCNLSAVPGAKTEGGRSTTAHLLSISAIQPSILASCAKPSWQDATTAI